jgi:glycine C-acetyltransferase
MNMAPFQADKEDDMALRRLDEALRDELRQLEEEGRSKPPERVINGFIPASGAYGPRYTLEGQERPFLRMNSNSYLSLSRHPALIEAADRATRLFGVGPGAVRFIDGTFSCHTALENGSPVLSAQPPPGSSTRPIPPTAAWP